MELRISQLLEETTKKRSKNVTETPSSPDDYALRRYSELLTREDEEDGTVSYGSSVISGRAKDTTERKPKSRNHR